MQDSDVSGRMDLAFIGSDHKTTLLSSPGGGQYALIDHDVNVIHEPHSDDTRYMYCTCTRKFIDLHLHVDGTLYSVHVHLTVSLLNLHQWRI